MGRVIIFGLVAGVFLNLALKALFNVGAVCIALIDATLHPSFHFVLDESYGVLAELDGLRKPTSAD